MYIDTNRIVSITDTNQNFSKVARLVEKEGEVFVLKNNKPKFKIIDVERDVSVDMTIDEKIDFCAWRILNEYRSDFEELAK